MTYAESCIILIRGSEVCLPEDELRGDKDRVSVFPTRTAFSDIHLCQTLLILTAFTRMYCV